MPERESLELAATSPSEQRDYIRNRLSQLFVIYHKGSSRNGRKMKRYVEHGLSLCQNPEVSDDELLRYYHELNQIIKEATRKSLKSTIRKKKALAFLYRLRFGVNLDFAEGRKEMAYELNSRREHYLSQGRTELVERIDEVLDRSEKDNLLGEEISLEILEIADEL